MFSASQLSSSIYAPMDFNRSSPEEFQWKIFLGEDLQAPEVLAVLAVSFGWEIIRDSQMVNIRELKHEDFLRRRRRQ